MNNEVNNNNGQIVNNSGVVAANVSTMGSSNVLNNPSQIVTSNSVMQSQSVFSEPPKVDASINDLEVNNNVEKGNKKKKKNVLARFYFFIILLLGGVCCYLWYFHQQQMVLMDMKCTPVSTESGSKELDLNSTIVKDLYAKVRTNLREDLGQTELNDELKLYLAFRQISNSEFYDSHCKLFTTAGMEPFVCEDSFSYTPKAFKADVLELEYKKLFGDDLVVPRGNIRLGNTCVGGYQYIESRGEYVQGQCSSTGATLYRVDKELVGAVSTESIIVLRERVKYYGSEGLNLPARLVSGTYEYTFKLDMNYNYVYKSKTLVN